jgi:hypothetical protein
VKPRVRAPEFDSTTGGVRNVLLDVLWGPRISRPDIGYLWQTFRDDNP